YRVSRKHGCIQKLPRDDLQVLRDRKFSYARIAEIMTKKRNYRISASTVRRFLICKRNKKKPYSPRSVPTHLHTEVKGLVDELYAQESTRTTQDVIQHIFTRMNLNIKKDVVAQIRKELGLRQFRVRYGHAVRIVNRLLRIIYIEAKLEQGEQFLHHNFSDESYVQLGKNSQSCFVKSRAASIKAAPKHVAKVLVWGAISVRGPSPCIIISGKDAIIDSPKYQQILHDRYVQWNKKTFGGIGVLVQDAAPCHVSRSCRLYFRRAGIEKLIGHVQVKMHQVLKKRGEPCPD
ncbi:hypothetical protein PFISCL1PPCAC_7637, partial [Pristionchus fissidentatus]